MLMRSVKITKVFLFDKKKQKLATKESYNIGKIDLKGKGVKI